MKLSQVFIHADAVMHKALKRGTEARAKEIVSWTLELLEEWNVEEVVERDGGWVSIYGIIQRGT